ncbi:hypothetical protein [Streptomyces sp. CA-132043]|uniref:hypothetical protein n=1 Tax=Streptomyces sp. CA-132043 TaxID=3240048 RepID=UPI003D92BCF5
MVNSRHEALHRAYQEFPELFTRAFDLLQLPDPGPASATVRNCDVTDITPLERRVDTLLELECETGENFLLIVESQSRKDLEKARSWAYYLSVLANRHRRHHPVLLVVCTDVRTAKWAVGPFPIGMPGRPNLHVSPFVLSPENVPMITDVARAAADLPMAVYSALTHSTGPRIGEILEALAGAMKQATNDDALTVYADLITNGLSGTPAAELWRELMGTQLFDLPNSRSWVAEGFRDQGREEGRAEGRQEGELKGKAEDLLQVLHTRGLVITAEEHARVTDCRDLELLNRWFLRAITAAGVQEVFAEEPGDATDQPEGR